MDETNLSCTVAVIGTGPAGTAAATVLAREGIDVMLLGPTPGEAFKPGESLPGAATRLLRRLGVADLGDLLDADDYLGCTANASAWGEEQWAFSDAILDPEGGGWHLLRHRFEAALLKHAIASGCRHEAAIMDQLKTNGTEYRIQGHRVAEHARRQPVTVHARWLVDASGRRAWLVRRLAGHPIRSSHQFAAVAWLRTPEHDRDDSSRVKSAPEGWWYSARLPGGRRVIAFHGLPELAGERARHPERLCTACNALDLLPYRVEPEALLGKAHACDASVHIAPQVSGARWLATGDAAVSFDPLNSQGMYFAMYSGIRGAEAIVHCLRPGLPGAREAALRDYSAKLRDVHLANQRARRLFYTREPRYLDHDYWRRQIRDGVRATSPAPDDPAPNPDTTTTSGPAPASNLSP